MPRPKRTTLGDLLYSFFHERLLQQRQASPATVATYKDALRLLLCFVAARLAKPVDHLDVQDLSYEQVLAFLESLEAERGNSVRTRNARLAVIHAFCRHVAYCDPAAVGLAQRLLGIAPKRAVTRVVDFLPPADVDAMLAAPNRRTARGRRDHVLLQFLLHTGVRASEALGVNAADLTLVRPAHVRIRGKGAKERVLPLEDALTALLRALLDERRLPAQDPRPVFVDAAGRRLTRFGLRHLVRRARDTAARQGTPLRSRRISPHSFRHTAAMRFLQRGVDLAVIRAWLGHANIQTTHAYLEADLEMKRRALAAATLSADAPARYEAPSAILALLET